MGAAALHSGDNTIMLITYKKKTRKHQGRQRIKFQCLTRREILLDMPETVFTLQMEVTGLSFYVSDSDLLPVHAFFSFPIE